MTNPGLPHLCSPDDLERVLEFEFVRATENAALNAIHWLGRGEKEFGDAAACDAIYGVFDLLDIRGQVVIGRKVNRFGGERAPGKAAGQHVRDDLADERAERVEVAAHDTSLRASSAASAACLTSDSVPDRYSRPVAPIIR